MECQCTHWLMVCQWISTQMVMRTSDWWHCLLTALFTVFSRVLLDDTISVHKANRARLIRVVGPFLGGKVDTQFLPAMENSTNRFNSEI